MRRKEPLSVKKATTVTSISSPTTPQQQQESILEEKSNETVTVVKAQSSEEQSTPLLASSMDFLQKLIHYMLQQGYSPMKVEKQLHRLSQLLQITVEEYYFDLQQYRLQLSNSSASKQFIQNTPNMGCNVTKMVQLENWIEKCEANPKMLSEFQKQFLIWTTPSPSSASSNYDWTSIMARTIGACGFAILLSGNIFDIFAVLVTSILVAMASYWNLSYFLPSVNIITGITCLGLIRLLHWPLDLSLIFLATSSNYLPGLSFFNGIWEVMNGKINMGTSRCVNAFVSAAQLAIGIALTFALKNANANAYPMNHYSTTWPFFLNISVVLVTVYILCMAFQVPIKEDEYTMLYIQAICIVTNLLNMLFGVLGFPSLFITFLNAFLYGLSSKFVNWLPKVSSKKVKKRYPISFKIVTVILMVPGSNLVKCFEWVALGKPELAFQSLLDAILTSIAIILGFTASDSLGSTLALPNSLCDL